MMLPRLDNVRPLPWPAACIVLVLGLLVGGGLPSYAAPVEKPAGDAPAKPAEAGATTDLAQAQQQLAEKYQRFEEVLVRMAELTAPTDPKRAALLRKAVAESKHQLIGMQLDKLAELLAQDRLSVAINNQNDVNKDLAELLELLLTEERGKALKDERQRLKEQIRRVAELINKERQLQGQTSGGGEMGGLAKGQAKVAEEAGKLAEEMKPADAREGKEPPDAEGGKPAGGEQKEGAEPGEGQQGSDGKSGDKGESKDGQKPTDGKDGENKKDGGKSAQDQDKDPAEKDAADKDASEKQKSADQSGDKSGDQPGDPSEGEPEGEQGSQGKPQKGSKGQPQPGGGQGQEQDEDDAQQPNQNQPQDSAESARKRVEAAQQKMETARQKLEKAQREGAVEDQEAAIRELEQAKAELEEILRQLREEELERMLAMLEARFRKMLQAQIEVYEGTKRVDRTPQPERDRDDEIEAGRLSRKESQIVIEADSALALLREEGSAVAFPEAVEQMREDMDQVVVRLGQADVGDITQSIEEDIIAALEEMIESLQKAQQDMEKQKQQQQQEGQPQDPPLIDSLAELKMIRSLQMRINMRTKRLARLVEGDVGQTDKPELLEQLQRLAEREESVFRVTRDIVTGKNK